MMEDQTEASILGHVIRLLDLIESGNDWFIRLFVDLIGGGALNLGHEWHQCSHLVFNLVQCMQVCNFDRVTLPVG